MRARRITRALAAAGVSGVVVGGVGVGPRPSAAAPDGAAAPRSAAAPHGAADLRSTAALNPAPSGGIVVSVDASRAGVVIPSNFLGLSFETPVLASPAITSTAPVLSHLLGGLGAGVLRISGVSVDRTQWLPTRAKPAPWTIATITPADLSNLAALMRATGWHLILGLNLGHPDSLAAVGEARVATSILGTSLAGLAIGNEPDLYTRPASQPFRAVLGRKSLRRRPWGLPQYQAEVATVRSALAAAGVFAPLYGPETATDAWLNSYAAHQRSGLAALTQHLYPLDRCNGGRLVIPGPGVARLLSRQVARRQTEHIRRLVRVAMSHQLPLRIDETNSVACAGQPKTSDGFAAALWAVNLSLSAAQQGVVGLNFHGGLGSCQSGGTIPSPWYSPLCTLADGRLQARPEYYGLLLLRALEGCAFVPVAYRSSRNISVYGLRAPDGSLRVVVDDMETPAAAPSTTSGPRLPAPVNVTLLLDSSYRHASVLRLSAPSVAAKHGVSFGGASLSADGSFPTPAPAPLAGSPGRFVLQVNPASAALVTLGK